MSPWRPSSSHWRSRLPAAGAASARAVPQAAKPSARACSFKRDSNGLSWDTSNSYLFAIGRSEEHTSELLSLMRSSYAVFCLHKKKIYNRLVTEIQYDQT